jgi:protein required for attachment to host cells
MPAAPPALRFRAIVHREIRTMAIWVLAAAAARARLFEAVTPSAPLAEVEDLVHPASRLREQELVSDSSGLGRHRPAGGGTGHSVGHEHDAPEEEWERFAREVAAALDEACTQHRFERLYVFAAPRFLGLLRRHLHASTRGRVALERDLDVTEESAEKIRSRLPDTL